MLGNFGVCQYIVECRITLIPPSSSPVAIKFWFKIFKQFTGDLKKTSCLLMTVLVFIGVSAFFNLVGSLVVYYEPGLSTAIMPILCIEFFTNFATDSHALSYLANLLQHVWYSTYSWAPLIVRQTLPVFISTAWIDLSFEAVIKSNVWYVDICYQTNVKGLFIQICKNVRKPSTEKRTARQAFLWCFNSINSVFPSFPKLCLEKQKRIWNLKVLFGTKQESNWEE